MRKNYILLTVLWILAIFSVIVFWYINERGVVGAILFGALICFSFMAIYFTRDILIVERYRKKGFEIDSSISLGRQADIIRAIDREERKVQNERELALYQRKWKTCKSKAMKPKKKRAVRKSVANINIIKELDKLQE